MHAKQKEIITCTILTLSPVSLASPSRTFRQGFGLTSKEALKARLCWVVNIVLGLFGPLLPSCPRQLDTISSQGISPAIK